MEKCPFNCGNIQNLECMFQDQPLRDVEQRLELFEIGVPVGNQIVIVIWPKMNFIVVDENNSQIGTLVVSWCSSASSERFNFCRKFLKNILKVLIIRDLDIMAAQPCPCKLVLDTSHKFPCACWTLTHTPFWTSFPVPENGLSSFRHSWEFVAGCWTLSRAGFTVSKNWRPTQLLIPRDMRSTRIYRGGLICAQEVSWHQAHWPWFCEGEVLVIRPHLLGESAQGYLLLNLREDEGQEEVLEDKDE